MDDGFEEDAEGEFNFDVYFSAQIHVFYNIYIVLLYENVVFVTLYERMRHGERSPPAILASGTSLRFCRLQ